MFTSTIKFISFFIFSFLILSFPIKNETLFYKLSKVSEPITKDLFYSLSKKIQQGITTGAEFAKKLFSNVKPKVDKISVHSSGIKRAKKIIPRKHIKKAILKERKIELLDEISEKDRRELEQLLN